MNSLGTFFIGVRGTRRCFTPQKGNIIKNRIYICILKGLFKNLPFSIVTFRRSSSNGICFDYGIWVTTDRFNRMYVAKIGVFSYLRNRIEIFPTTSMNPSLRFFCSLRLEIFFPLCHSLFYFYFFSKG